MAQFIPFRSRNLLVIFSTSFPLKIALVWTISCIVNFSVSHQKWELCMQLYLVRSVWMTYFKLQSFISKGREGKRKQVREGGGRRKERGLSKEKQSWHSYVKLKILTCYLFSVQCSIIIQKTLLCNLSPMVWFAYLEMVIYILLNVQIHPCFSVKHHLYAV